MATVVPAPRSGNISSSISSVFQMAQQLKAGQRAEEKHEQFMKQSVQDYERVKLALDAQRLANKAAQQKAAQETIDRQRANLVNMQGQISSSVQAMNKTIESIHKSVPPNTKIPEKKQTELTEAHAAKQNLLSQLAQTNVELFAFDSSLAGKPLTQTQIASMTAQRQQALQTADVIRPFQPFSTDQLSARNKLRETTKPGQESKAFAALTSENPTAVDKALLDRSITFNPAQLQFMDRALDLVNTREFQTKADDNPDLDFFRQSINAEALNLFDPDTQFEAIKKTGLFGREKPAEIGVKKEQTTSQTTPRVKNEFGSTGAAHTPQLLDKMELKDKRFNAAGVPLNFRAKALQPSDVKNLTTEELSRQFMEQLQKQTQQ